MLGFVANALAIATLCCCPPDKLLGILVSFSLNPNVLIIESTYSLSIFTPSNSIESTMFSYTFNIGTKL